MIGTRIGPFQVLRLLGAGGMGSVYLAEHSILKDLHAIKVLDPQLTLNPALVTRFVNEARAAAMLRHRNLVRVHNIERMPEGGAWFMVLDYLEGQTLGRFMTSYGGPVPPHIALRILAQVASCIQLVHEHRIVHRDLKPDNIFLIERDRDPHFPIVLDFGVAQLNEALGGPATRTGTVIGTPAYMAPEQLQGERVSPAADVFALGVVAYEMTTGGYFPYQFTERRADYFGLPLTEIYFRQRAGSPCDPHKRCSGLGAAWIAALRSALEFDPRARPSSARELALLLADAIPPAKDHADGRAIVELVAPELVHQPGAAVAAAARAPGAAVACADDSRGIWRPQDIARTSASWHYPDSHPLTLDDVSPSCVPVDEPVTTLDGVASQSFLGPAAMQRRRAIVGSTIAALLAGAVGAFAVLKASSSPATSAQESHDAAPRAARGHDAPDGGSATTLRAESSHDEATAHDERSRAVAPGPSAGLPAMPRPSLPPLAVAPPAASPSASRSPPGARLAPRATQPSSTADRKPGELAIIVTPWALISLDGKPLGQTPFRAPVAPGRYRLRLTNDDLGKDDAVTIIVKPEQTTTIERAW